MKIPSPLDRVSHMTDFDFCHEIDFCTNPNVLTVLFLIPRKNDQARKFTRSDENRVGSISVRF